MLASNYIEMIKLASIRLWIGAQERQPRFAREVHLTAHFSRSLARAQFISHSRRASLTCHDIYCFLSVCPFLFRTTTTDSCFRLRRYRIWGWRFGSCLPLASHADHQRSHSDSLRSILDTFAMALVCYPGGCTDGPQASANVNCTSRHISTGYDLLFHRINFGEPCSSPQ